MTVLSYPHEFFPNMLQRALSERNRDVVYAQGRGGKKRIQIGNYGFTAYQIRSGGEIPWRDQNIRNEREWKKKTSANFFYFKYC